jgi:TetR/AcrR family transcriptional repressor of nem operon
VADNPSTRERLLAAAIDVIRVKGYAATRVDDIALAAGVTKGSFFHHFATKEACAREAAIYWNVQSELELAESGHRDGKTPAARVLAYIDFRISQLTGPVAKYACYVGTILQQVHDTHPELAAESAASIFHHAAILETDLSAALRTDRAAAHDLAIHVEACIQGALLIAKAEGGSQGATASLNHLRRYLEHLLENSKP